MHKCKKKDCIFRAPEGAINTCDFRTITGIGRGCSIEGCIHYKSGERESARRTTKGIIPRTPKIPSDIPWSLSEAARIIPIPTQNITIPTQNVTERKELTDMGFFTNRGTPDRGTPEKPDFLPTPENIPPPKVTEETPPIKSSAMMKDTIPPRPTISGPAKTQWWDMVFADIDKGMDPRAAAEKYGVTYKVLRAAQGQRNRSVSKADEKRVSTRKPKPDTTQREETPRNEPELLVSTIQPWDWDDELINVTYANIKAMLNSVRFTASPRIKVIALSRIKRMIDEVITGGGLTP